MAASADPEIVVIGCGISGIAAAHRLVRAGFQRVRILEATARSGGRIKSGRLGNNITEIGASYIHGPSEENPVFCLARDYGLLDAEALKPENQAMYIDERPHWSPNWFSSSGQRLSAELMRPAMDMFNELMDETEQFHNRRETPWPSVGHFIRSGAQQRAAEKWKDKDENTRELLLCGLSAKLKDEVCASATHTMDEVDLAGFSMFEGLRGLDCNLPGAFEDLTKNLMSELPADLVSYNRPVRCIHWNDTENGVGTVTVECDDGERIAANHVIFTVPLGYLKKHHSTLFRPPLPAHKLHSVQKLGFGTCNKIYVEFESPWWDADCDIIHLVWEDEGDVLVHIKDISKSWIKKMSTFTVLKYCERGSHVLCGWISGQESEYMESLPEEELRSSITELIRTFTAVGVTAQDLENMMEPLPVKGSQSQPLQVLFAGEATHPCYYSTIHGALLTGWREADRLISHYTTVSP